MRRKKMGKEGVKWGKFEKKKQKREKKGTSDETPNS